MVDSVGALEHILINGRNISQESMSDQILECDVRLFLCALTIRSYLFPLAYNLSALCFQPLPSPHTLCNSQTIWFPQCVLFSLSSRPVPMLSSLLLSHIPSFSFSQPPPLLSWPTHTGFSGPAWSGVSQEVLSDHYFLSHCSTCTYVFCQSATP